MNLISFSRSLLFLPAHRLERFERAKASGPSVICVDLQDGLPESEKAVGRQAVEDLLHSDPKTFLAVRINSAASEQGEKDIKALNACPHPPNAVILPMIQHAADVQAAIAIFGETLRAASLVVMIETVSAICSIDSICRACPENAALLFGNADMSSAIGCANDWESLAYVRSRLILFAAKWRLPVFDGVSFDLENQSTLEEECRKGRKLGFVGKAAVHPEQVKVINRAFRPTAEEVAKARSIVLAYEASSGGAIRVGNELVDRPVYLAAQRLLKLSAPEHHTANS